MIGLGTRLGGALLLILTSAIATQAQQLPPDYLVQYSIREVAGDPNSPIAWTVTLELTALERQGDDIRWHVHQADIREIGTHTTWRLVDPRVDTASGDWWVQHVDADTPAAGDFIVPPETSGCAADVAQLEDDLDFSFVGSEQATTVPILTYSFHVESEPQPRKEGEDEEIDPAQSKPSDGGAQ